MTWYALVSQSEDPRSSLQPGEDFSLKVAHAHRMMQGVSIDSEIQQYPVQVRVTWQAQRPPDVLWEWRGVPAFSPPLQRALQKAQVGSRDIQFLPIHSTLPQSDLLRGFAWANILTRVAALDYQHCQFDESGDRSIRETGTFAGWQVALHADCLLGHDLIRLVELVEPIFVSQRFATVLLDGPFTGAHLEPVPVH